MHARCRATRINKSHQFEILVHLVVDVKKTVYSNFSQIFASFPVVFIINLVLIRQELQIFTSSRRVSTRKAKDENEIGKNRYQRHRHAIVYVGYYLPNSQKSQI